MTSIIMLVHNAYEYTKNTIETLQKTVGDYEIIVLDNNSEKEDQKIIIKIIQSRKNSEIAFSDTNSLFAKGNNMAAKLCHPSSDKNLLLNSDIDIRNPFWLEEMLNIYEKGIVTWCSR